LLGAFYVSMCGFLYRCRLYKLLLLSCCSGWALCGYLRLAFGIKKRTQNPKWSSPWTRVEEYLYGTAIRLKWLSLQQRQQRRHRSHRQRLWIMERKRTKLSSWISRRVALCCRSCTTLSPIRPTYRHPFTGRIVTAWFTLRQVRDACEIQSLASGSYCFSSFWLLEDSWTVHCFFNNPVEFNFFNLVTQFILGRVSIVLVTWLWTWIRVKGQLKSLYLNRILTSTGSGNWIAVKHWKCIRLKDIFVFSVQ